MPFELRINPIACTGHGACAELLPELIASDEWGYPVVRDARLPESLAREARQAVAMCPVLALALEPAVLAKRRSARPRSGEQSPALGSWT